MTVFVLVHGGWQGSWVYRRLAGLLRMAGHETLAPSLTGLGHRKHLAHMPINLETHLDDIENLIVCEDLRDVVLVGHSYGGMVITGVADRIAPRISALVYLDALVPENGKCLFDLRPEYRDDFLERAATGQGLFVEPPAPSAFDAREEFWSVLEARNVPHPLGCFTQLLELTGSHSEVSHRLYLFAKGGICDGMYDAFRNNPRSEVHEIAESGHSIMLDQPEAICRILLAAFPQAR